jgi:hypothetical protein
VPYCKSTCQWPHKVETLINKKDGVVTDRRRRLPTKDYEISKFKDGFVTETIVCSKDGRLRQWKQYQNAYGNLLHLKDAKPLFKTWEVPFLNAKIHGEVKFFRSGAIEELIKYKHGVADPQTLAVQSSKCVIKK